jgi:hypothetical protein
MPPEVDNDANPSTAAMTRSLKEISDIFNPKTELSAARYWSQEYNEAIHGNTTAQKCVQEALKEWAHLDKHSIGHQSVDNVLKDLGAINPKAARAFNDAIISHDGSIHFKHHPHK